MKRFGEAVLFYGICVLLLPVAQTVAQDKLPKEIKWVRHSAEYVAICRQTYRFAWLAVRERAATVAGDWAVILDVDETVLDNSLYEEELAAQRKSFTPASWDAWVKRQEAVPVPGAKAFLDSVRALGPQAHIVFITNREAGQEEATRENLRRYGMWDESDVILCRQNRADTKEIRRQEVISGQGRCAGRGQRFILALFGDQLGDLHTYGRGSGAKSLRQQMQANEAIGLSQFVLPNPMYGAWERGYK